MVSSNSLKCVRSSLLHASIKLEKTIEEDFKIVNINEFGEVEDAKVKIYIVDNIMENKEIILLFSVSSSFQPVSARSYAQS